MPTTDERKDAARYRHLRNDWWFSSLAKYRKEIACAHDVEALDEAIDTAIAEKGERHE